MTATGAIVSDDGLYRYRLWRRWQPGGRTMIWVMLNPSTADAESDDPTIRRCMGFARREGFGAIEVINLYALRCTKPAHLLDHPDPEGPDNEMHWAKVLLDVVGRPVVVGAWGASVPADVPPSRALERFSDLAQDWLCLGRTAGGHPRHPLYLGAARPLEPLA